MKRSTDTYTAASNLHPNSLRLVRFLGVLLLAATLSACAGDLTGPETEPEPPAITTTYDLTVTARYIKVTGSCDADDLFGNPTNGEFQYRYVVSGEGTAHARESDDYNSRLGTTYNRKPGELIDFANREYTWRTLSPSSSVEVTLYGAEWDGLARDNRMENLSGSKTVPFALGKNTNTVVIGTSASCQVRLYYDAEWIERVVQD